MGSTRPEPAHGFIAAISVPLALTGKKPIEAV
jgi:hypothetical protein